MRLLPRSGGKGMKIICPACIGDDVGDDTVNGYACKGCGRKFTSAEGLISLGEAIAHSVVLSHPLRRAAFMEIAKGTELSATTIAKRLDQPLGNVAYHMKVLREHALIVKTRWRPRRGARETFYRVNLSVA